MARKLSKKMEAARAKIAERAYAVRDAVGLLKEIAFANFDETVELALRLGVDPRRSEQMVRGTTGLPHGTGKSVRVLVFAKGDKQQEARAAGADFVGADDLLEKIREGWLEFDQAVATPDMMGAVGKLGKVLGPRGLMPNPKTGTVTFDVAKAITEIKQGRVEYKVDRAGNVHVPIGKVSFSAEQLYENAGAVLESIVKARPASSKGRYMRSISLSSTMGPGIPIDATAVAKQWG